MSGALDPGSRHYARIAAKPRKQGRKHYPQSPCRLCAIGRRTFAPRCKQNLPFCTDGDRQLMILVMQTKLAGASRDCGHFIRETEARDTRETDYYPRHRIGMRVNSGDRRCRGPLAAMHYRTTAGACLPSGCTVSFIPVSVQHATVVLAVLLLYSPGGAGMRGPAWPTSRRSRNSGSSRRVLK